MSSLFLTQEEINDLCAPLTRASSQVKYLKSLGLKVLQKRNGKPLVAKKEIERAFVSSTDQSRLDEITTPNKQAYLERIKKHKG